MDAGAPRVLELSTDIGGAYSGWLLANLGAEVTRVRVAEDTYRSAESPIALALDYLAQGKRSADIGSVDFAQCDVVVCDSAALLEGLTGETPASLARRHPQPRRRRVLDVRAFEDRTRISRGRASTRRR